MAARGRGRARIRSETGCSSADSSSATMTGMRISENLPKTRVNP